MNAIPYDRPEEEWDSYEEGTQEVQDDFALPGRPRRQWFNRKSAALFAVVLGAIGFYAGVRVEKNQLSNSSSTAGAFAGTGGAAARLAGAGATGRTGAGGATGAAGTGASGTGTASRTGARRQRAPGAVRWRRRRLCRRGRCGHLRNRQHDQWQHSLHHRGHR